MVNEGTVARLAPGHHRLLLEGANGPSGSVTPTEMRLQLTRTDEVADAFAHVHEAHHVSLNSSTAWGSLLHVVVAADGVFGVDLGVLVDECRLTHESYATYAAVSVIEARFGPQPGLLDSWPDYASWMGVVEDLVDVSVGPQRRYLLATALARVCMQCPVAEVVIDAGPILFAPSMLRGIDRPDGRFRLLGGHPDAFVAAAAAGDLATPEVLDIDVPGADSMAVAGEEFDSLWLRWEQAAYASLADTVGSVGGRALSYNGHQDYTAALIERVESVAGSIGVRGQGIDEPALSDLDAICSVLVMTHEDLIGVKYAARVLDPEGTVDDLVQVVADHSNIAGKPVLVVSALPTQDLASMYRWENAQLSGDLGAVRYGVRLVESDDDGDSAMVWLPVAESALVDLVDGWADRGPAIALAKASCLLDRDFQQHGLSALKGLLPTLVLADVTPDRLLSSWTRDGDPIQVMNVRVEDASGLWKALVFLAGDDEILWLVTGTEATVGLYRQGLETVDVTTLVLDGSWEVPLQIALTTVLALETSISFNGAEARI